MQSVASSVLGKGELACRRYLKRHIGKAYSCDEGAASQLPTLGKTPFYQWDAPDQIRFDNPLNPAEYQGSRIVGAAF